MPFSKLMGVEVTNATSERVQGQLKVRPDLCTLGGILHGGAIMAFADALGAIGGALNLPDESAGTTTIESKTNFLAAAKEDSIIFGVATPVKVGRKISVWKTEIRRDDNTLIAIVLQTQLVL